MLRIKVVFGRTIPKKTHTQVLRKGRRGVSNTCYWWFYSIFITCIEQNSGIFNTKFKDKFILKLEKKQKYL